MPEDQRPRTAESLRLLASGEVEVEGRMPWSSNGTYLCRVTGPSGATTRAIYKPYQAERPLWDFPDGLYRREAAAYELDRAIGWDVVPETVVRDGPLGVGSLQRFVDADFAEHYFTLLERPEHHAALRRMAAFDAVANNADRKGGHCLIDAAGHLWGIDHGLCFHTSPKLRTVIWDWAGDELDPSIAEALAAFASADLPAALRRLLGDDEADALRTRASKLVSTGRFPRPRGDHPYPWPLV